MSLGGRESGARAALQRLRVGHAGPVEIGLLAVVGLFMAAVGAYGTGGAPLWKLVPYWVVVMTAGGLIGAVLEVRLEKTPQLASRPWLRGPALTAAMSLPITGVVFVASTLTFGGMHRANVRVLAVLYVQVVIVSAAVVAIAWLARRTIVMGAPVEELPPEDLRRRLPPRLARSRLIAVQAEDHYVRIHTEAGDALVLMRFTDVLDALQTREGLQTHRSWWVAKRAVDQARWRRGRGVLVLSNGLEAPVSRGYASSVRATDWA